jgi:FixJ family two-component response regulator
MANETVLALDDDDDFLFALGELLEAEGFTPDCSVMRETHWPACESGHRPCS